MSLTRPEPRHCSESPGPRKHGDGQVRNGPASRPPWSAPRDPRSSRTAPASALWLAPLTFLLAGCAAPHPAAREQGLASLARPLLELDPDAVWTDAYNALLAHGPDAIDWLMRQPALARPAASDDVSVLLHTSLARLLADPRGAPPPLTVSAFETTLGVLHLDPKVDGRRLGVVVIPAGEKPRQLRDLFPAEFDLRAAAGIDLERDRTALRDWWRGQRARTPGTPRPLRAQVADLWHLLGRRYADRWEYVPEERAILARRTTGRLVRGGPAQPPTESALFRLPTSDYNLVRAACILLGSSTEPAVRDRLIGLLASQSGVVAHNARFALRYCPDPRVRAVLQKYDEGSPPAREAGPQRRTL